ncbi:DUF188 domain-containing protein [Halanaerobium sp. Z-7514]|uniref:DUF188 domain-containing protein n=1 Tax=Halanaerobium polyolivorans TaxID=2886943 RepID=A0AAW4WZE4_9FIRM|nr:DUF188 domain-containing protein [Halanaerobium polyolivorans]MCC3144354.1 DUF188 domain-containing protein [Halanaerobium polyolivorans]RQD75005.1 MAG: hypothetical protein D5S01_05830 [Halanaerobium sp. MSAO_Bac5]
MRILVDGDSCPVLDIISHIAKKNNIELLVFTDLNHQHQLEYAKIITVDQGFQSVDMRLYNQSKADDIIITSDYGLAALALSEQTAVISFSGREFTNNNIERLLAHRHRQFKERRRTARHTSHKKRSEKDDLRFKNKLLEIIKRFR